MPVGADKFAAMVLAIAAIGSADQALADGYSVASIRGSHGGMSSTFRMDSELLRRASPSGDLVDWLDDDDQIWTAPRANPDMGDYAKLVLDVDPQGHVSDCEIDTSTEDGLGEAICRQVTRRAVLRHALNADGTPGVDTYEIVVAFDTVEDRPGRRVRNDPMPPPLLELGESWPPRSASIGIRVDQLEMFDRTRPFDGPWAAVALTRRRGEEQLRCSVRGGNGDGPSEDLACAVALQGRYDFSRDPDAAAAYLLMVQQEGRFKAILPVSRNDTPPTLLPHSRAAIQAALPAPALRFELLISREGTVAGCMIAVSSGNDAEDLAACTRLREQGSFNPARDVFGTPRTFKLRDWALSD